MIGLDTNILVRYLIQDDEVQSPIATEIIEHQLTQANPGYVSVVTMAEIAWVLDRSYDMAPHEIAFAVERMLQLEVLVIESEQEVFAAMVALKQGQASLADALIAELGTRAGCRYTLTFDNRATRLPGFRLPLSVN